MHGAQRTDIYSFLKYRAWGTRTELLSVNSADTYSALEHWIQLRSTKHVDTCSVLKYYVCDAWTATLITKCAEIYSFPKYGTWEP